MGYKVAVLLNQDELAKQEARCNQPEDPGLQNDGTETNGDNEQRQLLLGGDGGPSSNVNLAGKAGRVASKCEKILGGVERESHWSEKRLLALVEKFRKANLEKKANKENGKFVVLEVKELLKYFTKDGLPVNEVREPLVTKRMPYVEDLEVVKNTPWGEAMALTHPSLSYNKGEESEQRDLTAQRVQNKYVGINETLTTGMAGLKLKPTALKQQKPQRAPLETMGGQPTTVTRLVVKLRLQ